LGVHREVGVAAATDIDAPSWRELKTLQHPFYRVVHGRHLSNVRSPHLPHPTPSPSYMIWALCHSDSTTCRTVGEQNAHFAHFRRFCAQGLICLPRVPANVPTASVQLRGHPGTSSGCSASPGPPPNSACVLQACRYQHLHTGSKGQPAPTGCIFRQGLDIRLLQVARVTQQRPAPPAFAQPSPELPKRADVLFSPAGVPK